MTYAEAGGLLVAVLFGLSLIAAYVLYRMGAEFAEALQTAVNRLRRGESGAV